MPCKVVACIPSSTRYLDPSLLKAGRCAGVRGPRLPSWAGLKARPTVLQQELLLRRVSANSAKARTLTHSLTLSAASRLPSSKNCRSRSLTLSDYPTNTCVGDQTEMPRLDKWGWPLRSVYPQTGILTVPSMPDVLRPYPRLGWTFRRGLLPAGSAYAVRTRTDQDQRTESEMVGRMITSFVIFVGDLNSLPTWNTHHICHQE